MLDKDAMTGEIGVDDDMASYTFERLATSFIMLEALPDAA